MVGFKKINLRKMFIFNFFFENGEKNKNIEI